MSHSCQVDEALAHDGWQIVREVVGVAPSATPAPSRDPHRAGHAADIELVSEAVRRYLEIEHGGGAEHRRLAQSLFHPECALLAVGEAAPDEPAGAWSAPAGSLLEVPLSAYLETVAAQAAHAAEATKHDAISSIEMLRGGGVACATVRVGNGEMSRVYEDHLLLATVADAPGAAGEWRIISKTFAPRPWPAA